MNNRDTVRWLKFLTKYIPQNHYHYVGTPLNTGLTRDELVEMFKRIKERAVKE